MAETIQFPGYVTEIITRLRETGFLAYAVGGCVRDSLLGRTPHDWDVTTSARPEETMAVFDCPRFQIRAGNGLRHGTVTVWIAGDAHAECEITTFRSDGSYSDHRRPDTVSFVREIGEDLRRRDFTVNAMAAAPACAGKAAEFLDLYGGQEDLRAGVIRCVGDPRRRFEEDALRILRGIRFAARYGFSVEENTAEAMRALSPLLSFIAPERIGAELGGILQGDYCGKLAEEFGDIFKGLLPGFSPEGTGAFSLTDCLPAVRLALFCRRAEEKVLHAKLIRYAMGAELADAVVRLLRFQDMPLDNRRALCRIADQFGEADAAQFFLFCEALSPNDAELREAKARLYTLFQPGVCYNTATLCVNGKDLMAAGIPRGKRVGELLSYLTEAVISEELPNEREALLRAAAERIRRTGDTTSMSLT